MECRSCEYYINGPVKHYCYKYKTYLNAYSYFSGGVSSPQMISPLPRCIEDSKTTKAGKDHSYEYDQCLNRAPYRGLCFTCCNGNKCERPEVYNCPNYVWRGLSDFEEV